MAQYSGWISDDDAVSRDVFGDDAAGPNDGAISDCDTQYNSVSPDPDITPNVRIFDRPSFRRQLVLLSDHDSVEQSHIRPEGGPFIYHNSPTMV